MNEHYIAIAAEVWKRLQTEESVVLTEADLRKHMPVFLTRASGNLLAGFLADQAKLVAGVEMFINEDTGEMASIQILIARTARIYWREQDRLKREFIASFGDDATVAMRDEQNLFDHNKRT